jgi:hypothetical protein
MNAAAAMRLTQLHGEPKSTLAGPPHAATAQRCRYSHGLGAWGCMNIRACLASRCPHLPHSTLHVSHIN